jgi:adenylate cyclase
MVATQDGSLRDWLLAEGRHLADPAGLIDTLAAQLMARGVPLARVLVSLRTVHPQIVASGFVWQPDRPTVEVPRTASIFTTGAYNLSPIKRIHDGATLLHDRLAGPDGSKDYPVYDELRAEGFTDYVALPLIFSDGTRNALTAATRRAEGFTPAHVALLQSVAVPLAALLEVHSLRRTATALLDTYVGHDAGRRILAGNIRRGIGERIHAVIALADLRGFTQLSDSRPTEEVIAALNDYFGSLTEAIHDEGGQVMKFMGDGLLAIFPLEDASFRPYVVRKSLAAAKAARAQIDAINRARTAEGFAPLRYNLALHIGDVVYGNIGAAARLDFTVIGPAVNLAARLETLAAQIGVPILASHAFAEACREAEQPMVSLGRHRLKGVAEPEEAFTSPEFAAARQAADAAPVPA